MKQIIVPEISQRSQKPFTKELETPPHKTDAPIQVFLAYDGQAAFQAAREIYRGVVHRLAGRFEFREYWLPFGALTGLTSQERAANAAAEAEMVFVCPGNGYVLPRPVQDWLGQWLLLLTRRRQPDAALVTLVPVSASKAFYPTPVERDLRATAQTHGLAFFAREYIAERPLVAPLTPNAPSRFGEELDAVAAPHDSPDFRHWGINE